MIRNFLLILLLFIFCLPVIGQNETDSIIEAKTTNGIRFEQSGKVLSMKDIEHIVCDNEAALTIFKTAKTYNVIANVLSGCGSFMISYTIGYFIPSGYFNATMFVVGCGLGVIAIPVTLAFKNKLRQSIAAYNGWFSPIADNTTLNFHVGIVPNGVGVKVSF